MPKIYTTGLIENGIDLGDLLIEKSYLIDVYPQLVDWSKTSSLWAWGENGNGQLGDGTIVEKSSPVQTIAGGNNWKQVSASVANTYYVTSAIKTDGTLWLWGANGYGQLGDDTNVTRRSSPVQTIAGGTNWKQVSVGEFHCSAVKTDGTLWLWGANYAGELGDGTIDNKSSPVQTIAGGNNWKQVAVGWLTAAIKTDGTLWLWGGNSYGGLGDGTNISRSSPVQTIAGGTNWKQVSVGTFSSSAIKTDGTLWSWGDNYAGQLGDNSIAPKSSPVQTIAGGTNWKQAAVGFGYMSAVKTDGTLWLWGSNIAGQLGTNDRSNRISPVQTIAGGNNWKQVSLTNQSTTSAVKTDGTLWLWGDNFYGGLGDNTDVYKSSPVQTIAGGTNWKQTSGSFAIREDGNF
jgi:alpha-tubulin suppressor-like RCC1 family protein